jgi:hypothetical protein
MIIGGFFFTIAVILMIIYVFTAMLTIDNTERVFGSGLIKAAAVCGILGLIFSFVEIVLL